ncbi:MAG: hydrolase, partial [Fidelibacterota bacterium]
GLFAVGSSGEVDMFFSRRIGIGPDNQAVPIIGGGRITGKVGAMDVGFLNMSTEEMSATDDTDAITANNFTVARAKRELPNRSALGAILVNRMGHGMPANDYNRTLAVDGRVGIGRYGQVEGFLAKTATPDLAGDDVAFKMGANYNSEKWELMLSVMDVGSNFNPEVGFLRHENFTIAEMLAYRTIRPKDFFGLHEIVPHISYRGYWNHISGSHQSGLWHIDNHWEWKNGHRMHTGFNITHEGLEESFEIYAPDSLVVPAGSYNHVESYSAFYTNRAHWWWASIRTFAGGYFGGTRIAPTASLGVRYREKLNMSLSFGRNTIDLPGGKFWTNLVYLRTAYSFTPRFLIMALLQYNDKAGRWSANAQLRWLQQANTGLFIVYNQGGEVDHPDGPFLEPVRHTISRSIILKYTHMFDVFR